MFPELWRSYQRLFSLSFSFLLHNLLWSYSITRSLNSPKVSAICELSLLITLPLSSRFSLPSFVTFHLTPQVPQGSLQLCLGGSKLQHWKLSFEAITHLTASFHSCHWAAGSFYAVEDLDAGSPKQLSQMRHRTDYPKSFLFPKQQDCQHLCRKLRKPLCCRDKRPSVPALFSCISKDSALLFRDGQKVGTKIEGKIRCNVFKVTGRFCWEKKNWNWCETYDVSQLRVHDKRQGKKTCTKVLKQTTSI